MDFLWDILEIIRDILLYVYHFFSVLIFHMILCWLAYRLKYANFKEKKKILILKIYFNNINNMFIVLSSRIGQF